MNKQEAKQKLHNLAFVKMNAKPDDLKLADVMQVLNQIHEPQKVVVPKHIADKIEYCKNTEGYGLFHAMDYCFNYKDSAEWLEYNQETFAHAWLDGYEVEKEQLYTVEIPNPNGSTIFHLFRLKQGVIVINESDTASFKKHEWNQLTESEIKQDFEWAWQFAKEVE